MVEAPKSKTVEDYLNEVSYADDIGYVPSEYSLKFVNFIKLVNGKEGEENKTPVVHYKLLDNVFSGKQRLAILCHRGFAKSTLLSEYLPLYCAVFGKLEVFGEVSYMLFIGDSLENGCRNMRKNMENRYNQSEFLQKYLPKARFTDTMIEFTNLDGKQFAIRLAGAQQSIRGTRYLNKRPELCIMDDILTDQDAKSPTCIANINNTIHRGVDKALHPTHKKVIYVGTCYNANDPLYRVIESGRWSPSVFPVCEEFPVSKEEFRGSWPERFPYEAVKAMYDDAISLGRLGDFNVEMMNRVMSSEDRLVDDSDLMWYSRKDLLKRPENYNFYITTDFSTSEKASADFSVISVWAVNNRGYRYYVDGVCKRQTLDKALQDLFRLVQIYNPLSVGIEVTGQQQAFINWIQKEMMDKNIFFNLASTGRELGIRPTKQKFVRFVSVVPWFKQKIMYFPDEMRTEAPMVELLTELSLISAGGIKSKHDDMVDTISMLGMMEIWNPSGENTLTKDDTGIWVEDVVDYVGRWDSYIV